MCIYIYIYTHTYQVLDGGPERGRGLAQLLLVGPGGLMVHVGIKFMSSPTILLLLAYQQQEQHSLTTNTLKFTPLARTRFKIQGFFWNYSWWNYDQIAILKCTPLARYCSKQTRFLSESIVGEIILKSPYIYTYIYIYIYIYLFIIIIIIIF